MFINERNKNNQIYLNIAEITSFYQEYLLRLGQLWLVSKKI